MPPYNNPRYRRRNSRNYNPRSSRYVKPEPPPVVWELPEIPVEDPEVDEEPVILGRPGAEVLEWGGE